MKELANRRPFRVGRSTKVSVLDYQGLLVVMFEYGQEDLAQLFCDFLNGKPEPSPDIYDHSTMD